MVYSFLGVTLSETESLYKEEVATAQNTGLGIPQAFGCNYILALIYWSMTVRKFATDYMTF